MNIKQHFWAFAFAMFACSSGGSGGTDAVQQDIGTNMVTFRGVFMDFQSKSPKEGVDLLVLNDDTGEPLDLEKYPPFKSGKNGKVELTLPAGILVAFKASGKDSTGWFEFKTSYLFHVASNEQDRNIYGVNILTYNTALSTAFVKLVDPNSLGHLAGTVYYVNEKGEEEFIGCLIIEVLDENGNVLQEQKGQDGKGIFAAVRYFDTRNDMPTSLEVSSMTHKYNSRYMVANLPKGRYTVRAKLKDDGSVLSQVSLMAFPDSITIGNMYLRAPEFPSNPTPARDECIGEPPY
jgi:hypothetical protein